MQMYSINLLTQIMYAAKEGHTKFPSLDILRLDMIDHSGLKRGPVEICILLESIFLFLALFPNNRAPKLFLIKLRLYRQHITPTFFYQRCLKPIEVSNRHCILRIRCCMATHGLSL